MLHCAYGFCFSVRSIVALEMFVLDFAFRARIRLQVVGHIDSFIEEEELFFRFMNQNWNRYPISWF